MKSLKKLRMNLTNLLSFLLKKQSISLEKYNGKVSYLVNKQRALIIII